MKEFEIRPKKLFEDYLKISKKDIDIYFADHSKFVEVPCPACKSDNARLAFNKHSFTYKECDQCSTLFVSPRPMSETIDNFYIHSESSKFWAEHFFPETADARREMIFKPRAKLIDEMAKKIGVPQPASLVDVGAGYGIFLEEVKKTGGFSEIFAVEPSIDLAKCCRDKGFTAIEKPVEKIEENEVQASVACSFEVFEHLFDPDSFVNSMKRLIKPGGIILFTTLTISGLDLQVLWDKSKSISPPHHLNFFSIEGLKILLRRCGLTEVEIVTPGKLDVDIIKNTMAELPELKVPRFIDYMIKNRDEKTLDQFQLFLQQNNLSSHVRVVARK
ncbi:MAG: class I SAM-dependent methyltransferase [bacterium]|nr:class I SAM-dependent methyltransferase [bacterium]